MMNSRCFFGTAFLITSLGVSGCSSLDPLIHGSQIDYKSASEGPPRNTLEVPPDLSALPRDDRFNVPNPKGTTATYSDYMRDRAEDSAHPGIPTSDVLPTVKGAHMERAGGQRWLVVHMTPEELWPILKEFWQSNGFLITVDSPATGIMETNWAENHAKLPLDIVRRSLGKLLDSIYDTGERDKFRTRLERRPDGGTEIYISHRGMVEVVTSQQNQTTVWTQRPSDPELEAEFLRRLLVRLGSDEAHAKVIVAAAQSNPTMASDAANTGPLHARLVKLPNGRSYVWVDDPFDRAWRRVGLALDRVSFTVEDRDRSQGIYYVRYVDPAEDMKDKGNFFSRMFSSSDKGKLAAKYRVVVSGQPDDRTSHVTVQDQNGAPDIGDVAPRILTLLNDQLK